MHWTIFALLSAASAAAVAILGKMGLKHVDTTLATSIRSVVMAVFLVAISLSLGKFNSLSSIDNKALLYITLSGIAGALSWLFYFFALKMGPASGVSAVDRTSAVFVLILAILFLGETFTWIKVAGSVLIVAGAVFMIL